MAQKTKVKELVGRGLNSYHTKALQQIDRIEKKNKEQNHKISILSNELDNDYLTKTEEGSVISLEHSKEGMVYLDELQGNTLVNYCTDGSKELTLNGDIDIEGTFVTTTEGVDGGKVDVMCEGNTLVNLMTDYKTESLLEYFYPNENSNVANVTMLKPNTVYTLIYTAKYQERDNVGCVVVQMTTNRDEDVVTNQTLTESYSQYSYKFTTPSSVNYFVLRSTGHYFHIKECMLLEGDWTNKELPSHFEGMKSVGELEENKIEILSQSSYPNLIKKSKNLSGNRTGSDSSNNNGVQYLREDNVEFARVSANKQDFSNFYWWLQTVEPRKKGETYTISYDYRCVSDWGGYWYPSESYSGSFFPSTNGEWRRMKITRTITSGDAKDDMLFGVHIIGTEIGDYIDIKNVKMEKGTNNSKWIPSVMDEEFLLAEYSNKKEILINEPLRATENYKDKFVKINGKWFIERNCDVEVLDGTNPYWYTFQNNEQSIKAFVLNGFTQRKRSEPFVIENYPCINSSVWSARTGAGLYNGTGDQCGLAINESDLTSLDDAGVKEYLSRKPIRLVYAKDIPTYEPLQIEPTLNTYNDVTHISNNSIIPCNMKIKNSGYNAIIKPSTLYTVALDTNKSGTIGINLGGAKVTTTNNVATVTTPATLTDDSLRLYGKGIKGSKVRLLEGDKTNWIPSHFEGMKSSFEDKVQEDGSYKMEISSKNKNLFTHKEYIPVNGLSVETPNDNTVILKDATPNNYKQLYLWIRGLKANVNYIVTSDVNAINGIPLIALQDAKTTNDAFISKTESRNRATFKLKQGHDTVKLRLFVNHQGGDIAGHIEYKNIQIREETTSETYEETKSNKIQFSSIEPLRNFDRFVYKDSKLMIERGSKVITFNGSEPWAFNNTDGTTTNRYFLSNAFLGGSKGQNIKNTLCDKLPTYQWNQTAILGISRTDSSAFVYNKNITNITDFKKWLSENNLNNTYKLEEPTYEEIPFELQKIILEGYENGTLFFDTNIPPTSTVTYAGETPIVKATKLNKTEVLNNTNDINDNIIPYLMDMDYRVVMLQLATEELEGGVSMARLFGGTYEMIKRDILSKRLTREEYGYRLADYFNAGKLTEEQVRELEELR